MKLGWTGLSHVGSERHDGSGSAQSDSAPMGSAAGGSGDETQPRTD